MSKLTSEQLEELQSFGRYFETMGNLINILRRGAMSVRYTELDYEIFCDEIEGALELTAKVQKEITDKFFDFVNFMEMDPDPIDGNIENLQLDDSDPNGDAHERSVVKGQAKRDAVGQPLT